VALLVLGLVALLPDCASACSCGGMPGSEREQAERELAYSSAVFAGEVVDFKRGVETIKVSFRVSEVWKGPEQDTLEVSTIRWDGVNCGSAFEEGQEYLVYAHGKEDSLSNHDCGRTMPLSEASADLELLGNGEALGGSGVLYDTSGGFPPLGVLGMLGGAVAADSSSLSQVTSVPLAPMDRMELPSGHVPLTLRWSSVELSPSKSSESAALSLAPRNAMESLPSTVSASMLSASWAALVWSVWLT
jgi:hypothetical protein